MTLPDPLVPPHVDLRDLDGFMLNTERLLASELIAIGSGDEIRAALILWARSWKQLPAASLPDDDRVLAGFAMVSPAKWKRIRSGALHGFTPCSDGRLYHRVLAKEALSAWERKRVYTEKRNKDADRLKRWRERSGNEPETPAETRYETRFVAEIQGQGQGQGQVERKEPPPPSGVAPQTNGRAKPTVPASLFEDGDPEDPDPGKRVKSLDSLTVDDELRAWAKTEFPNSDPDRALGAFRDYCKAKGRKYKDYRAALRNWIRTEDRFANGRAAGAERRSTAADEALAMVRAGR